MTYNTAFKKNYHTTIVMVTLGRFFICQVSCYLAVWSGKQNIAEASMASAASKETEIKLTNVARASLEELLLDYQDFFPGVRFTRVGENSSVCATLTRTQ